MLSRTDDFRERSIPRKCFGSRWVTELRLGGNQILVHGLEPEGDWDPTWSPGLPLLVRGLLRSAALKVSGAPGRFIYVDKDEVRRLTLNLRVSDTSRAQLNLGTEIRVVREDEFAGRGDPLVLGPVPPPGSVRATLRLYAPAATSVALALHDVVDQVELRPGRDEFDPAYAEYTFRFGVQIVEVHPRGDVPVWGLISLTNNETQLITTITPQR